MKRKEIKVGMRVFRKTPVDVSANVGFNVSKCNGTVNDEPFRVPNDNPKINQWRVEVKFDNGQLIDVPINSLVDKKDD